MKDLLVLFITTSGLVGWLIIKSALQRFLKRQSYLIAYKKRKKNFKLRL